MTRHVCHTRSAAGRVSVRLLHFSLAILHRDQVLTFTITDALGLLACFM